MTDPAPSPPEPGHSEPHTPEPGPPESDPLARHPREDRPLRLLQVMAGARQGGAETYFVTLTQALQRRGIVQAAAIRSHPERRAALEAAGVPVTELRLGGPLDLRSPWQLRALARRFRPDICLTWMERASARMPRGPYRIVGRIGGYYKPKYFTRCDHLACITPKLVERMVGFGWPAERVHFLPNFSRVVPQPPVSRAEVDTPEGVPLLLALSRLHRNKALDVLLRALERLPGVHLWLAGEGPERAALEAQAAAAGLTERVRFLGWRQDRSALLAACDVVVFPSRQEPFGTVTLEAWAHGKPLVAAAADGPAGFVRHGEDGLLVAIDSAEDLSDALRRVLEDPAYAAGLARAGEVRYRAEFTEEAGVTRWLGLFREVLS